MIQFIVSAELKKILEKKSMKGHNCGNNGREANSKAQFHVLGYGNLNFKKTVSVSGKKRCVCVCVRERERVIERKLETR